VELLPVRVEDERAPAAPEPTEIVLTAGERILVGVDVDAAELARVVRALSRRWSRFGRAFGYGWRWAIPTCARVSTDLR
jgi:hypothetical protein